MQELNNKKKFSELKFPEWNVIASELQNAITASGQTLNGGDLTQLSKAFPPPIDEVTSITALRALAAGIRFKLLSGYTASGDGGGGLFYWDSTSTATDDGGITIKLTAITTGRYIRVNTESISLKMFGAIGDGVADDTTAIQTAIDSVITKILVTSGTYLISSTIKLKDNLNLIGDGRTCVIKQKNSTNLLKMFEGESQPNPSIKGLVIKGITFDYNKANNTLYSYNANQGRIFDLDGAYDPWMEDVRVLNSPSIGILYGNYNETKQGAVFKNIYAEGVYAGIWITGINTSGFVVNGLLTKGCPSGLWIEDGASAGVVSNVVVEDPSDNFAGIIIQTLGTPNIKDINISNVMVSGSVSGGVVYTRSSAAGIKMVNVERISISNVKLIALTDGGITGTTSGGGILDNVEISNVVAEDVTVGTAKAIDINSGTRISLTNVRVRTGSDFGMYFNLCDDVDVKGGSAYNYNIGYYFDNTTNFRISDVRATDNQGVKTQVNGIAIVGVSSANGSIKNCNVAGNIGVGITVVSGTTTHWIAGNQGYNPIGTDSIIVGASPFTFTNIDNVEETIHINAGTVSQIAKNAIQIGAATGMSVNLMPGDAVTVTYSAAPNMARDRH